MAKLPKDLSFSPTNQALTESALPPESNAIKRTPAKTGVLFIRFTATLSEHGEGGELGEELVR